MAGLYDERVLGAQQRAEFARKLRESSNQPAGQMVSGWYVPNTGGAVVDALRNVLGAYEERQAADELKGLQREKLQSTIQAMNQAGIQAPESMLKEAGTPEIKPGMWDRLTATLRGEEAKGTPAQPYQQNVAQNVSPDQKESALMNLLQVNPDAASGAIGLYNAASNRELTKAEKEYQHAKDVRDQDWRQKTYEEGRSDRLARETADRDLRAAIAGNKQQQSPYEYKEINGQPFSFNRFTNQLAPVQAPENSGFPVKKLTPEQQRVQDANDAIEILKEAAPLVNKSTSSGFGAGIDYAAALIGKSTEGADTAAKLKVLGGALVSKMPKMSGPQSDKDVLLYKEMAGKLGDPTVPTSQKIAAMNSINELQAKYAGINPVPLEFNNKPAQGNWKITPLGQ